ncbi:MAG: UbiX family flavin prenyltransferase [Candidatus Eisenbacteria bacterium]
MVERRYLIAMTGASGAVHGVDFVKRCPGEKFLVLSDWARQVLFSETGLKPADLEPHVKKIFADADLAAPFASGSNRYDAMIVIPCSVSTLAKIAAGIADTLITRAAAVALKERMRLILCLRETPLSSIALENALKLSREGVVIMPVASPWYRNPRGIEDLVAGFTDKVLALLGEASGEAWREGELE